MAKRNLALSSKPSPQLLVVDSRASLHDLLKRISTLTKLLCNGDNNSRGEIYRTLDKVANIFRNTSDSGLEKILSDIYRSDKGIWDETEWEIIKWSDQSWHESNNSEDHKRKGIKPVHILALPRSQEKIISPTGVVLKNAIVDRELRIAHVYGATSRILSPKLHP